MIAENPLLTVVVPVYNVEKYLADCLESLLNQTVVDHKIIVVNDGSKDSSGEIAKSYAEKNPDMIRYVEQENKGLGAARNTGLTLVDTEYVTFLDSDDWWDSLFIEKVKRELFRHEEKPDIIFTLPWIFNEATRQREYWHDKILMEQLFYPYGGEENVPSYPINIKKARGLELYNLEASSCRRIYQMAFLRRINFKFAEGVKWEDVQPHFLAIHHARNCIGVKSTGFIYRINTGNQITTGGGASRLDIVPVFRSTLQMAVDGKWDKEEIGYIIKTFWDFTTWSIDVTDSDYILPLLKELHIFLKEIPHEYIDQFLNKHSLRCRRDKLMIKIIKSSRYDLLKDYRMRIKGGEIVRKIKRIINRLRRR